MMIELIERRGAPLRALDFGGGRGDWAHLARAAGLEVVVMDVASATFGELERWGIRCEKPLAGTACEFGIIHVEQVFEHLPHPASTLARLVPLLAPKGIVALGVPWDPQLAAKLRQPNWRAPKHSPVSLNAVAPLEHLNAFSPIGLHRLASRHGLAVLRTDGWDLPTGLAPAGISPQRRLRGVLRAWLRDEYRPAFALTQTQFFEIA